jgi:hypothetical protein
MLNSRKKPMASFSRLPANSTMMPRVTGKNGPTRRAPSSISIATVPWAELPKKQVQVRLYRKMADSGQTRKDGPHIAVTAVG